jgi:hypothetical protein
MELEAKKIDGKVPGRAQFAPVTPSDVHAAMETLKAAGEPFSPENIRTVLGLRGLKTDQERRAELEKVLAQVRERLAEKGAQASLAKPIQEPPANVPSVLEQPPPAGWRSPVTIMLKREEAARAKEQTRLQAAHERSKNIKAAGQARDSLFRGNPQEEGHGPHYATPDGQPYGSSRPRRD